MTHDEVVAMVKEIGLPNAYDHFAEGEAPEPPFICFLYPNENEYGGDDTVYFTTNTLDLEVYTDKKDPDLERKIEAVLTAHEIFYHKFEIWIESEQLYEVLYEMTV